MPRSQSRTDKHSTTHSNSTDWSSSSSENFADGAGSDGAGSDGTESDGGDWRAEQALIVAELLTLEEEDDEEVPIEEAVKVRRHCSLRSHQLPAAATTRGFKRLSSLHRLAVGCG